MADPERRLCDFTQPPRDIDVVALAHRFPHPSAVDALWDLDSSHRVGGAIISDKGLQTKRSQTGPEGSRDDGVSPEDVCKALLRYHP